MRKLAAVLGISAGVHTAVLAWASAYTRDDRVTVEPETPTTIIELVAPPPPPAAVAPIDVAFLDKVGPATASPEPGRMRRSTISTGTTPATTETIGPSAPIGPRNPYMDMRRPGAPKIALPTKMEWDPDMPAGPPPPPDVTTGQLDPSGNGTHRSDQGPFVAKVGRDGSVKLKDKKNFSIRIALPSPKQLGKMIGDWYQDPNKPVGFLPPEKITKAPVINAEESSGADKKRDHGDVTTIPILAGGFDISDALMRRNGQDPYASKKLAFLDSTREERVQIGMRHRSEQLAMAPQIMKKNLERLWATVADPAERREVLYQLWDEVEEAGSDELVEAGRQARQLVIAWIRWKLPAGSPHAYSTDELAALNKRRTSKAVLAPY
ncbi:MAG: hypothetical protein H0T46_22375 [Deltaproteobacteria bacterium]|nr:hypothetical protein [Deltaproteobacteria bacterium]